MRYLVVLVVGGCWWGKDTSTPSPAAVVVADAAVPDEQTSPMRQVLTQMWSFRDRMCTCRNVACADTVQAEMTAWANDMAKRDMNMGQPDPDEMREMTRIGAEYGECRVKLIPPP